MKSIKEKCKFLVITLFLLLHNLLYNFAQELSHKNFIDSLRIYVNTTINSPNDNERINAGKNIENLLINYLIENSIKNILDDSIRELSIVNDRKYNVTVITWCVPLTNGTFKNHGLVHFYMKEEPQIKQNPTAKFFYRCKEKNYYLVRLNEIPEEINQPELKKFDHTNWYGACYYKMIPKKLKNKVTFTLLGWKGNNFLTQKKVIDEMFINKNGRIEFAGNFYNGKKTLKRLVFEYSTKVVMSVKYEEKSGYIVMDHLSAPPVQTSSDADLTGEFFSYGPDFSYDALEWKNGTWILIEKYDARNPKEFDSKNNVKKKPKSDVFYKK